MKITDIPFLRLANQQISTKKFKSVKELAGYMGAFQAQDYEMAKWAIGIRLERATEQLINNAIDKGEILRTHLLRPTWHFVSSDNINWMLKLTASRIRSAMSSRNKDLELTEAVFKKSNKIIRSALAGNNHLTREELVVLLNKAKIKTDNNRASHILAEAELTGLICSGKSKGNKHTYALFEERVANSKPFNKEESLASLAQIYFKSRGPATLKDFSWWSGLNLTDSRLVLDSVKSELDSFNNGSQTYWFSNYFEVNNNLKEKVYLLPTYDEYIISYTDRSSVLISEEHKKIVSINGLFRAIIVINGVAVGTWKRTIKKDLVIVELNYFNPPDKKTTRLVKKEALKFGDFLAKEVELVIK